MALSPYEKQQRYKARFPERVKLCKRKWQQKNMQHAVEKNRTWRRSNLDKSRASYRRGHLKKTYGIALEEWDAMLASQGGVCAICLRVCRSGRRLAVDHDHTTKKVRGLLCRDCNQSLGKLHDSAELLERAAVYLRKHAVTTQAPIV